MAAELAQRRPGREAAGPTRRLGGEVRRASHRASGTDEVRRRVRDGGDVYLGPAAEREPGVVGNVQPLVAVTRPRVGVLNPLDELPSRGARSRPKPEGPVD